MADTSILTSSIVLEEVYSVKHQTSRLIEKQLDFFLLLNREGQKNSVVIVCMGWFSIFIRHCE